MMCVISHFCPGFDSIRFDPYLPPGVGNGEEGRGGEGGDFLDFYYSSTRSDNTGSLREEWGREGRRGGGGGESDWCQR